MHSIAEKLIISTSSFVPKERKKQPTNKYYDTSERDKNETKNNKISLWAVIFFFQLLVLLFRHSNKNFEAENSEEIYVITMWKILKTWTNTANIFCHLFFSARDKWNKHYFSSYDSCHFFSSQHFSSSASLYSESHAKTIIIIETHPFSYLWNKPSLSHNLKTWHLTTIPVSLDRSSCKVKSYVYEREKNYLENFLQFLCTIQIFKIIFEWNSENEMYWVRPQIAASLIL